jgi:uncharacterized Zn finger protein (UPF0148 family)
MNKDIITCPMCGHRFDAVENASCQACPLKSGCQMVCCPECGYQTVNTADSALARAASHWFTFKKKDSQAKENSL